MATSITDIVSILSEKESLIEQLLLLLAEERKCIVEMETVTLEEVDDKKRQLLVQLENSNNTLRQAMRQLTVDMNLPEDATISTLLAKIDARQQSELKSLQARILQQGTTLQSVLEFNRELLQGSLRMVNRSLDFFGGIFKRSTTYGQAGSMVSSPADLRLVCKEI